jgi:hypothetical protein
VRLRTAAAWYHRSCSISRRSGKTGDLKSHYSMAVYISNFTCDGSVTAIPPSAGFWHYDGHGDAPLSTASLRSNISSFFLVATGRSVPVTTNHGEIYVGVCGDQVCDSFDPARTS